MNEETTAPISPRRPVKAACELYRRQIAAALHELRDAENIHNARKLLKLARATLRLLRPALGDAMYRRENRTVRDASRPLSRARDAEVLIATLASISRRADLAAADVRPLQDALERRKLRIGRTELKSTNLESVRARLRSTLARSQRWRWQEDKVALLLSGVRRTYRMGRRAFDQAAQQRTTEHLHDWRKQVKYLWHQLQLLRPAAPRGLTDRCHRLSDLLGEDHDLAVLATLLERSGRTPSAAAHERVRQAIASRRTTLQDKAAELGARIFRPAPRAFVRKLERRWPAEQQAA